MVGGAQKGGGVRDYNKAEAAGGRVLSDMCNVSRESVKDGGRGCERREY